MRYGYVDLDFKILDQLLRLKNATVIGGKVPKESTLRLFLVLDEKPDRFDDSWKILNIEDLLDPGLTS